MSRQLDPTPVKFFHQKARILLLVCCCFVIAGCANQPVNGPISQAQMSLKQAHRSRADAKMAIGYYLNAADSALKSANSSSSASSSNSQAIYNSACQELAILLKANPALWNRNETVSAGGHTYRLQFTRGSRQAGIWDPSYFDRLHNPVQLRRRVRRLAHLKNGWGGALVGVYKPADPRKYFLPPQGLAVPVTAAIVFNPVRSRNSDPTFDARFALYDPAKRETGQIDGAKRPLAADLTATYHYYPNPFLLGIQATLRPANHRERAGLYLLEPYDSNKIPIVFVHGLMSVPQMWITTINAIESDPELRGRFQFWVFTYPTGDPILLSALRFRESIESVYRLYPETKGMILIGHSMGGIVSRLQAVTTGRVIWDAAFKSGADRLYATLARDDLVKRAVIFKANPRVKRIVFICTPHRGSYLASNWLGALGVSLIRFPSTFLGETASEVMTALQSNAGLKRLPTGIYDLSPRSLALIGLNELPIEAPYHSIIGDRGRTDSPISSDGVVAYWSSHLDGAQSELIVPGSHGAYALPQTVAELKRILRLHLAESGCARSLVVSRRSEPSIAISKTR
ncbi:MAG TPA: alpha/beta fold hydrolase [Chthoniobacterales bacterium]|nr:alpha/beta fold hydrolase [Chthoniobacterales bacterium]